MRTDLPDIIADIYHRLEGVERRFQSHRRTGTVAEVDATKGLARIKLGEDPKTGKPFLSPWVPWTMPAMGATKINIPPSVGQQVEIVSETGDMTDAIINTSLRSDANPMPDAQPGEVVIVNTGKVVFRTPHYRVEAGKVEYVKSGGGGGQKPGADVA